MVRASNLAIRIVERGAIGIVAEVEFVVKFMDLLEKRGRRRPWQCVSKPRPPAQAYRVLHT